MTLTKLPDALSLKPNLRQNADLSKTNWFGVGGRAEYLFKPENVNDLAGFLAALPAEIPVTVLGVGSNIIIRDGGIDGVVVKLGRGFTEYRLPSTEYQLEVGAANLDLNIANFAAENGIAGLEFLSGIPGTIGGAVRMNAGAYGADISQVLVSAEVVTRDGKINWLKNSQFCHSREGGNLNTPHPNPPHQGGREFKDCVDLNFSYRKSNLPAGAIVTKAILQGKAGKREEILTRIAEIKKSREETQPIRERTGGSTFKNPEGNKAWELIDRAGCRGLMVGGAQMSEKHCNFMINTGNATASDLENLGEEVIKRVLAKTGITLEWEIKRIGKAL